MSGIAGIINFDGAPVEPRLINNMTSAMAHRGPDGINHWVNGPVALGQCMLHTTRESLEESQPLTNNDESLVLVMDGRVDNWLELRKELKSMGVNLRDCSDAELVLRAYESWNQDCLDHIDGDFALVVWDAQHQKLFCARDRMGNKPFNYYWDGRTLVFASDLNSILELSWVPKTLHEGVLAEYLAAEWFTREETIWEGIHRLVAAHQMQVTVNGPKISQYWAPDLWNTLRYSKDEEYVDHYRELLSDSVRRSCRSHRPVAIEVSGGLDSSAIFVMADHLNLRGELLAPGLKGYTLDFHDDPNANELEYCRDVGDKTKRQITQIRPFTPPLSWYRNFAKKTNNVPPHPNGAMALDLTRQASSVGCRVELNGTGGDEWLGGSRIYYAEELALRQWGNIAKCFRSDVSDAGWCKSLWWLFRCGLLPLLPFQIKQVLKKVSFKRDFGQHRMDWLAPHLQRKLQHLHEENVSSFRCEGQLVGKNKHLNNLYDPFSIRAHEAMERLSAMECIELRRPYYNSKLVEFSFAMPQRLLFREGKNKFAHRQALEGLLPESVMMRETKAEFSITYKKIVPELAQYAQPDFLKECSDWIDEKKMPISQKHCKYGTMNEEVLWALVIFDALKGK